MGQTSETSESSSYSLAAEALRADPRVAEARRLISEAVADHTRGLLTTKPALPERAEDYAALLERLAP